MFRPTQRMVDLAKPGARIAAGISTSPVSSDDGPHLISREDPFLAPGIKNGGFGAENDSREHRIAGNLCEHSVWNRRAESTVLDAARESCSAPRGRKSTRLNSSHV